MSSLLNCTRCELCSAAMSIYSPMSFVHLSLIFRLVVEPICIVGITLLTITIFQTRTLHFNARVLLLCVTTSVTISNVGILIDAFYKLYVSFVLPEEDRCEYQVFKPRYFHVLRCIYIVGGLGFTLSSLFLSVERSIATALYKTYEKHSRRYIGFALTTIQVLICVLINASLTLSPQCYPYVAPDTANSRGTKIYGNVIYGMNMVALLIFAVLYLINRRRRKSLSDLHLRVLSTRFQLRENIATTRLMTPVMLLVMVLTTSSQWVYYFYLPDLNEDTVVTVKVLEEIVNFAPYSEYQMSLIPVMTAMLVIVLPYFHIHIKRSFLRVSQLRRCFPERLTSVDALTVDQAQNIYFEKLKGQWHERAIQY